MEKTHHDSGHHVSALAIFAGLPMRQLRMEIPAIGLYLERVLGQPLLPRHKTAIDDLICEINQFQSRVKANH